MPHQTKEALLEAASETQRSKGILPTAIDNETYLTGILERMDRRAKDAKPNKVTASEKKDPDRYQRELKRRADRLGLEVSGNWSVTSTEKPLVMGGGVLREKVVGMAERRLRERLRMLRSKPEWERKIKSVNPLALQGHLGAEKKKQATEYIKQVIRQSNDAFGHWMRPKSKPAFSYTGQVHHG